MPAPLNRSRGRSAVVQAAAPGPARAAAARGSPLPTPSGGPRAPMESTPPVPSRLPQVAAGVRNMSKGGPVNQHKRMAMGDKVTGMKKGGRPC